MNATSQRICAWGAPVGVTLTFGGLVVAGLFPPIPPVWEADRMAAVYQEHSMMLRFGAILVLCAIGPLGAFVGALAVQMKRMEGDWSPMTYTQMLTGVIGLVPFISTPVFWCAAAFRAERSPEQMLLLNDMGWMTFVMVAPPFVVQVLAFAFAVLGDKQPRPVFPRWMAFFSFWVAVLGIPGMVVSLFRTGPFAWNGIFTFWLGATVFGLWLLIVFVMLLKAIGAQERAVA